MCLSFQKSAPVGNVTVAFTHEEWGRSVPAPRHRFQEAPEKSRNLVLLGKGTI